MQEPMDETPDPSRRTFLKEAGQKVSGVAVLMALGGQLSQAGAETATALPGAGYDPLKHRYIYLVDIDKCIGCGSCVRACAAENDVPDNHYRTWIEHYRVNRDGEAIIESPEGGKHGFEPRATGEDITKSFFVPKICNHCSNSPCVQLCPVGASFFSPDGLVLVDQERCIGCSYCVQACPYGSRFIHPVTHTASKCTLCYHRITKGLKPACVDVCPTGARQFGDTMNPNDEVADYVARNEVRVLKPEMNTEPKCYYAGLGKEVR